MAVDHTGGGRRGWGGTGYGGPCRKALRNGIGAANWHANDRAFASMSKSFGNRFAGLAVPRRVARLALRLVFAAGLVRAQSGIERPQLSWMLDSNGGVHPVYGVPGATTLGDPIITGALAIGCSPQLCLAKTAGSVISFAGGTVAGSLDAPPGPALLAFDGNAAWVYFSQTQQLMRWQDGLLTASDFVPDLQPGGKVLSLRAAPNAIDFAVRRRDGVWIERWSLDGSGVSLLGSLERTAGAVMLLPDGVMFATPHNVILRHIDGSEIQFEVPQVNAFFASGDGSVQLRAGDTMLSVRTNPGRERISLLPGVSP
jgi:hypothetical protein